MMKRVALFLLLVVVVGACGDSDTPMDPGQFYEVQKVSGDNQTGMPGQPLPYPYVVRVVDAAGGVVPDAEVFFSIVSSNGGALSASSALTDSTGIAWVIAILPDEVNVTQTVEARTSSGTFSVAFTSQTGLAGGDARSIRVVSGDAQKGITQDTLLDPLVVEVTDEDGVTVSGVNVQWAVVSSNGGSVRTTPTVTDEQGLAQNRVRAGDAPGELDEIIAWIEPSDAPPDTVRFTADITGVPDTIVIVQGAVDTDHDYTTPEFVVGDTSFVAYGHWARQPFKGIVLDADGRTVRGATLTWTVTNYFGAVGAEPDGPGAETVMINTAEDGAITVWRKAALCEEDCPPPAPGDWINATLSIEDYPDVVPITLSAQIRP